MIERIMFGIRLEIINFLKIFNIPNVQKKHDFDIFVFHPKRKKLSYIHKFS